MKTKYADLSETDKHSTFTITLVRSEFFILTKSKRINHKIVTVRSKCGKLPTIPF
jgi:hypothetical protein